MNQAATLPTENEAWGFFGTMNEQAAAAWPLASAAVATATGRGAEAVRNFLDSTPGRHFADDVLNAQRAGASLEEAVAAATKRWMAWIVGRETAMRKGVRRGEHYLTAFVDLAAH